MDRLETIMMEIWRYQDILTTSGNRQRANIEISFAFSGRQLRGHAHHEPSATRYAHCERHRNI